MTRLELIDLLEEEIASFPGKTSLLMMDLTRGVELLNHDGDTPVPAASTIQLPILMATLDLVAQNQLRMDQTLCVSAATGESEVFEPENASPEYTLMELLEWMTVRGDNIATNAIIDLIGMDAVNQFCTRIGAKNTLLQCRMGDAGQNDNVTTARDQFMLYSLMAWCAKRDTLWQEGMEMLYRQRNQNTFLRYLCGPLSLAHLPGLTGNRVHDAGLFMNAENPFFLGIFTWDTPDGCDPTQQQRFVAKLAKQAYNWRMGLS